MNSICVATKTFETSMLCCQSDKENTIQSFAKFINKIELMYSMDFHQKWCLFLTYNVGKNISEKMCKRMWKIMYKNNL